MAKAKDQQPCTNLPLLVHQHPLLTPRTLEEIGLHHVIIEEPELESLIGDNDQMRLV
jgi:hypothetical protein